MKKLLYSLLTLAAALTVTSCLKEVEGGSAAYDDGTLVDATFSVTLGPQTKAFADGTAVNQLYAGIYEITGTDIYAHVTHTESPAAISGKTGEVSFTGKIKRGHSYKIVFWAQKEGAPYTLAWGDAAPTVTVNATGNANDESRDAFYGEYLTGVVSGNIDLTGSPITLKRPFAQVNVLVPKANFNDPTAAITSSMTVYQAPTKLNLASKETSVPKEWSFASKAISEAAFGDYDNNYKYVAMNYVLVDQAAAGSNYDVKFTVNSAATAPQTATDRQVKNAPLKANVRTNIIGNVFDENFNLSIPITIDPNTGTGEDIRPITITVGGNSIPAGGVNLASGATSVIQLAYSAGDTPTIEATSDNEDAVKIIGIDANNKTVTVKGFNDGVAIITITVGAGTKSGSYIATSTSVKYIVGTPTPKTLENIAISGYTTEWTVGQTFAFDGTVTATYDDSSTDDVTSNASVTVAPDMSTAATGVSFTVSYTEGGVTKTANGTINVAAAGPTPSNFTVTVTQPTHGTITLKNGETAISLDGEGKAVVEPSTVVTVFYTDEDYAVDEWTISGASLSNGSFTMPSGDVAISVTERAKEWKLVTSVSSLSAGDRIVLVATVSGDSTEEKNGTFVNGGIGSEKFLTKACGVEINNNKIANIGSAVPITLGKNGNNFTLTTKEDNTDCLIGTTAAKTMTKNNDQATNEWSISIDSSTYKASISAGAYGTILYNRQSPRFVNYTSDPTAANVLPWIYRYE